MVLEFTQIETAQLILGYSIRLEEQYFFKLNVVFTKSEQSKNYFKSKIVSIVLLMFTW